VSAGRIPERERHRYLTALEVAALAAARKDQGDVVTILAYTGLRWSELVGLHVGGDIDLPARRLHARRAAPEVEGRIIIGPPKTRAAKRIAPLPKAVIDALKPRVAGRAPDEPAITSPNGAMLRPNNWRRYAHWSQALRTTNVAPLTLRHTYASLARKSGADLATSRKPWGSPRDLYSDELDHVATNLDRLHDIAKNKETRGTDRNRTHRNIPRVLPPSPCSSRQVARAGIEPATFRFSSGKNSH
jgi:integrase